MKEKESVQPLIGVGTSLEVSGHAVVVTGITKEGVECKVKDVRGMENHAIVLDFDKIVLALQNQNLNSV